MFSSISGQKRKVILKPKPFKPLFFRLYVSCFVCTSVVSINNIPSSLLLCVCNPPRKRMFEFYILTHFNIVSIPSLILIMILLMEAILHPLKVVYTNICNVFISRVVSRISSINSITCHKKTPWDTVLGPRFLSAKRRHLAIVSPRRRADQQRTMEDGWFVAPFGKGQLFGMFFVGKGKENKSSVLMTGQPTPLTYPPSEIRFLIIAGLMETNGW